MGKVSFMKKKLCNHIDEFLKIRSALDGIPLKTNKEILSDIYSKERKNSNKTTQKG